MATRAPTAPPSDPGEPANDPTGGHVNEVRLRGRVSAPAIERVLPSGDVLVTARLVVRRPAGARSRQPIDVLNCQAWSARSRRALLSWQPGSLVEVEGAIRRRFRRNDAGSGSWMEIEVVSARRVRAAPSA
ncbi:MAG: single-stranded DNA-binding protein [Actinomycetota bacterium]|nr:single-stranded DNA-binding protein [Actinomycetota bacterium]